jgi:hypothetical protein
VIFAFHEDLKAIGFAFAPGGTRWSMHPELVPRVLDRREPSQCRIKVIFRYSALPTP